MGVVGVVKPTPVLCVALLLAAMMAGCSSKTSTDTESGSSSTSGATSTAGGPTATGAATTSGGPGAPANATAKGPNHAPLATLAASVQKGGVPLNVTFTLGGKDEDASDSLSFKIVFGDGTPAVTNASLKPGFSSVVKHSFTKAGRYNATVTVTDAAGATGTAFSAVNATSSAAQLGPKQSYTCTVKVGTYSPAGGVRDPANGIGQCNYVTLDAPAVVVTNTPAASCTNYEDGKAPLAVGQKYASGALLVMKCSAGAANAVGTLEMQAS